MSTTKEPSTTDEEYQFTPKLSARWALNLEQVLAVAFFGVLFVLLNFFPIRGTDIWGHIAYGQWILDHQGLPQTDLWMPLAAGMQVIDSAWLSQVIFAAVDRYLGPESLSHLFAIVNLAAYVVWARVFFLQTRRVWLSLLATSLLIFVGWSRAATIRPENFAVLCFALLFWLLISTRANRGGEDELLGRRREASFSWLTWLGVPAVFALWANMHGSFLCGLAVLGCFLFGRALEVGWRTRSFVGVLQDGEFRRWVVLAELAVLATLLNPYGLDLLIYTIKFSGNANLQTVLEWQPLMILGTGGTSFAVSIVLLLLVWRQSRRPIEPVEVLLLAVFGWAAVGGVRMLGWYAPVFVFAIAPHVAEIAGRLFPARREEPAAEAPPARPGEVVLPPGHSFRYSLVAVLLVWIAFALSPSSQLIFKKSRTPEQLYDRKTPLELTVYLGGEDVSDDIRRAMSGAIVFHPQPWGDWLKRTGGDDFQPFVTSNVHLAPAQVWRDYLRVESVSSGWDATLSRYDIDMVIVDKKAQRRLLSALNLNTGWSRKYEDDQAAVFVRAQEIPGESRAESPDQNEIVQQEG